MKKLYRIKNLIIELKYNLRKLRLYGFECRYVGSASGKIWVNRKLRIVVKKPCIVNKNRRHPKIAIPTVDFLVPHIYQDESRWDDNRIFIQPLANRRQARKALMRIYDTSNYRGSDMKCANVGWYRGKPVLIDW